MNETVPHHSSEATPHQIRQFQTLLLKLFQCCRERSQYQSERFDLPDAELRCLLLFSGERHLTAKTIAPKMNVVKSRITKIVAGLTRKGLLARIRDPEDSRVTLLSLTPDGQKKLKQIESFNDYVHTEILKQMEPEQRKIMLTNLELLKASMVSIRELMT